MLTLSNNSFAAKRRKKGKKKENTKKIEEIPHNLNPFWLLLGSALRNGGRRKKCLVVNFKKLRNALKEL